MLLKNQGTPRLGCGVGCVGSRAVRVFAVFAILLLQGCLLLTAGPVLAQGASSWSTVGTRDLGETCANDDACNMGECRNVGGTNFCVHCGGPGEIACTSGRFPPCESGYQSVGGICVRTSPLTSLAASCGFPGFPVCPPNIGAPCHHSLPLATGFCLACGGVMQPCCLTVGDRQCDYEGVQCIAGLCQRIGWQQRISSGVPFRVIFDATFDKFNDSRYTGDYHTDPLGTLMGGESYEVVYRNGGFDTAGFNQGANARGTWGGYRNANPAQNQISLWGRVFTFNQAGEVFDAQYGKVGHLRE